MAIKLLIIKKFFVFCDELLSIKKNAIAEAIDEIKKYIINKILRTLYIKHQ